VVCRRQTTRDRRIRAFGGLPFQQYLNCLVEAPAQDIGCSRKRENSRALHAGFVRQMKTVNRIEKKLRAHALERLSRVRRNSSSELFRASGSFARMMRTSPLINDVQPRAIPCSAMRGFREPAKAPPPG